MSTRTMMRPQALTQAELRTRRRTGLSVVYTGKFDLAAEISDICQPLAARAACQSNPPHMFAPLVRDLVDAVHGELISTIVGWLAEISATERVQREGAHLDSAGRKQAVRHLTDLAPRPLAPKVGTDELASGSWATALIELAQPHTGPLADLLARSRPPGDPNLRASASRSERLCDLLRHVDTAARQLEIRIDKAERAAQRRGPASLTPEQAKRAELRKLGIEV
ncbi:hypothetical protein ACTWP6_04850 [Mycobacterium sp. 4D054]|uniref:hypothetical protein n=1 Tax=Mycobacterium sp. 4D054 TaxID=3457440 RepID=UPI003FD47257